MLCSLPGFSVLGIFQARILEWVAMPSSRGSSQPRDWEGVLGLPHCRQILCHLSHERSPRILEGVAYPSSRGSSWPRNSTEVSWIAGGFFTSWATRGAHKWVDEVKWSESPSVVSNSLVHGILQARTLEWVVFPFPGGSSQPRDRTQVSWVTRGFLPAEPQGKPINGWLALP